MNKEEKIIVSYFIHFTYEKIGKKKKKTLFIWKVEMKIDITLLCSVI